jgi:sugar phosphate isomerase/epimerase
MPETRPTGYALNVFPAETLAQLRATLTGDVARIKHRIFPDTDFPIELRFSERIVAELQAPGAISDLRQILDTGGLRLVTVNAFVMPHFHGERVKERVYLPAWHESDTRLRFTNTSLDLLARLGTGSVSVPFGALKPVSMTAVAPNIIRCAEHAATTGCVLALEPEPGLCVETTDEVIEFFDRFVPDRLRPHVGVNFDLAHQLVEFENLADSIARLQAAGILITKIHVSNAVEMPVLKPFYQDSIYLHQTTGAGVDGKRAWFSLDWPETEPPKHLHKFRIHYHLPVCELAENSTLPEVERFLINTLPTIPSSIPAIVETYTWPQQLRGQDCLMDNICAELKWVLEKISLSAR